MSCSFCVCAAPFKSQIDICKSENCMQIVNGNGFLIQTATTIDKRFLFLNWNCRFPVYIKSFVKSGLFFFIHMCRCLRALFYEVRKFICCYVGIGFFINTPYFLFQFISLCFCFHSLHLLRLFAVTKWSISKTCKLLNGWHSTTRKTSKRRKELVVSIKLFWQKTKCHANWK